MEKLKTAVLLGLTAVVFISFFLPWVRVESRTVGTFSKVLTGKRQNTLDQISAFRVPLMANGPDARLMITIIQLFNPGVKDADKKSWLIWGIPLFAILIFVLYLFFGANKWFNLAIGILGCVIFFFAVYKIKTTDLDKAVLQVTIAPGVWLTLWGYFGIGITGATDFVRSMLKK